MSPSTVDRKSFTKFLELPLEIQRTIWKFAITPRVHHFRSHRRTRTVQGTLVNSGNKLMRERRNDNKEYFYGSLKRVNVDSSEIFYQQFPQDLLCDTTIDILSFDLKNEVLYPRAIPGEQRTIPWLANKIPNAAKKLKRLALHYNDSGIKLLDSNTPVRVGMEILGDLPGNSTALEELIIVFCEYIPQNQDYLQEPQNCPIQKPTDFLPSIWGHEDMDWKSGKDFEDAMKNLKEETYPDWKIPNVRFVCFSAPVFEMLATYKRLPTYNEYVEYTVREGNQNQIKCR